MKNWSVGLVFLLGILFMAGSIQLRAEEGMWIPLLLEKYQIEHMQESGLRLTAEEIYSINQDCLKDALVIFGRGCTGEMVSADGLLLTNHHCGYGAIQRHSSVESDYLTDGFWAMSREEELVNPGLSVRFLERIEDVTERVLAGLNDGMTEDERKEKIKEIGDEIKAGRAAKSL
ncbi:MAG: S46 family peptidase, partial [Bacteroidales bacterium]|nr:S46 family peptidase [Bacteroidales bacterium]